MTGTGLRVSAPRLPDGLGTTLAVVVGAVAAGTSVAALPGPAGIGIAVLALTFALAAGFALSRPLDALGTVALGIAVLFASWNAVRVTENATFGDPFFLLATLLIVPPALAAGRALPAYLLAAGLLIALTGSFTAAASGDFGGDFVPTVQFLVAMVALPVLIAWSGRPALVARVFVFSATVGAGIAVVDALTGAGLGPSLTGYAELGRQAGLSTHSNHLALTAAMAIPFAVQRYLAPGPARMVAAIAVAILGAGILVSGSRAGIVAAAAGTVATLALGYRHVGRRALVVGFALGVVALVFASQLGDTASVALDRLTGKLSVEASDSARAAVIEAALADVAAHPVLGTGYGNVRSAHNIYLQMLHAGGIVGFAAFATFIVGTLRAVDRSSALAAAAGASTIAWLAAGLAQTAVYDRYLYIPAGVILALWLQRRTSSAEPDGPARPAPAVLRAARS